jgi:BRCA1-associated protein
MEEAMLSSKLDAVALEYNQLLTSQLESQRQYFEGLIATARADAERSRAEADRCVSNAASGTPLAAHRHTKSRR